MHYISLTYSIGINSLLKPTNIALHNFEVGFMIKNAVLKIAKR